MRRYTTIPILAVLIISISLYALPPVRPGEDASDAKLFNRTWPPAPWEKPVRPHDEKRPNTGLGIIRRTH